MGGFAASIHALIQIKSNPGVESQRKKHKLRRKREKKQERRRTRVRDTEVKQVPAYKAHRRRGGRAGLRSTQ